MYQQEILITKDLHKVIKKGAYSNSKNQASPYIKNHHTTIYPSAHYIYSKKHLVK